MIPSKKLIALLALLFTVAAGSSIATWAFTRRQRSSDPVDWKKELNLTPEQEAKFRQMETDLSALIKEMELKDAEGKIDLCSHLNRTDNDPSAMKAAVRKMTEAYEKRQTAVAGILASAMGTLEPHQRKAFSHRMMMEVCQSCRKAGSAKDCMCGMCSVEDAPKEHAH